MFAPFRQHDPMRVGDGTCKGRYDCPDLAALHQHRDRLRAGSRISSAGVPSPTTVGWTSTGCSTVYPG